MKSMIFAPNATGELTVPLAMVMWVTYRLAEERKEKFKIRIDNRNVRGIPDDSKMTDITVQSIRDTAQRIGICIEDDTIFFFSDHEKFYNDIVDWFVETGFGRNVGHDTVVRANAACIKDILHGPRIEYNSLLRSRGVPYMSVAIMASSFMYDEYLHVRGCDLLEEGGGERPIFIELRKYNKFIDRCTRPDLEFLHLPEIVSPVGDIHKSKCNSKHLFRNWVGHRTVFETRRDLENMILKDGSEFCVDNILRVRRVVVDEDFNRIDIRRFSRYECFVNEYYYIEAMLTAGFPIDLKRREIANK